MTYAQVVETSVTVTDNSPFQDYPHPDDHTTRSIIKVTYSDFLSSSFHVHTLSEKKQHSCQNTDKRKLIHHFLFMVVQRTIKILLCEREVPFTQWGSSIYSSLIFYHACINCDTIHQHLLTVTPSTSCSCARTTAVYKMNRVLLKSYLSCVNS